jgi:EAL and modified HD-GYP domain-containing signal transduction protein
MSLDRPGDTGTPAPQRIAGAAGLLRYPVLDTSRSVHAYVLADPSADQSSLRTALREGLTAGMGLLFVPATAALLDSAELHAAPADQLVLRIDAVPGDDPATIAALHATLLRLHQRGMRIAMTRGTVKKAYRDWLALASYVQLSLPAMAPGQMPALLRFIRAHTNAQAVASGVENAAQFEALCQQGVALFLGDWVTRLPHAPAGRLQPAQAVVIQLLNLLHQDADVAELEAVLRRDPGLAFELLRMINTASHGLAFEVTSLRHAMMILGHKRLTRWVATLMARARAAGTAPAVASTALVRGRLMELLAEQLLPPHECDNAFVAGLFSLLDVLLEMPMAQALESLVLPESVAQALLRGRGVLAPFLALTLACESGDDAAFAQAAEALQLDNHHINWSHLQALAWAGEIAQAL